LSGKPVWMIDSGASCHMSGDLDKIENVRTIPPVAICLPNDTHTLAKKQGQTTLEGKTSVRDVLYVPELNCNMLSVAKLGKDLNCAMTFFDKSCVLQDRTSRTLIGVGEQRDGVYYYAGAPKVKRQVNAVASKRLWHNRFGHPSSDVLSTFFRNLEIASNEKMNKMDDVCDICYRAKQT